MPAIEPESEAPGAEPLDLEALDLEALDLEALAPEPEPEASGAQPLDLEALADLAPRPDDTARSEAHARLRDAAVAAAGLGRLESLAAWVAAAQGVSRTAPIQRARVVLFAGDHGVTELAVSASAGTLQARSP